MLMLTPDAISPRLLGVVGLLMFGGLYVVIFLILKRASLRASRSRTPVPTSKIQAMIRRLQFCVVALPVLLIFGLWETRGEPLLPRLTGAAINISFMLWFIYIIRRSKRHLP